VNDKHIGLYEKFRVERTDGRSAPGKKHHECRYFVLDLVHDPFVEPALRAYAKACRREYASLAFDLNEEANAVSLRHSKPQRGGKADDGS
jgi:hypothetical protein